MTQCSEEKTKVQYMKKILVVDDEYIIRNLLGEILTSLGYEPILCESPVEALVLFKKRHEEISLVFTDMVMPEISGRQLFQEFVRINPSIKVVILSGYSVEHEINKLIEDGVSAFIQKPVSIKELSRVIQENIA